MAEVTGLRNNALPYPVYAAPFGLTFPLLDADGDPVTGASGLDSEVSKNGDTYADCTNEATEIATSSGTYYLLLTATEMTADVVSVIVKSSSAKTTVLTLYPRKLVTIRSGTAAGGAAGYITLDSGASAVDDFYNGMLVVGTLDSAVEARIITDYTGSNKQAAVTPNWNTTPDSDDTFIVYLPEGVQINQSNTTLFGSASGTFASGRPEVNTSHWGGTAVGSVAVAANIMQITGNATSTNISGVLQVDINAVGGTAIPAPGISGLLPVDMVAVESDTDVDEVLQTMLNGGTYALDTDANGRIRIVDGIGAGELETTDGLVTVTTATVNAIAAAVQAVFVDDAGTAQAGAAGTITLRSGAVASDDYYNGAVVKIVSGTGLGQSRRITDYVGSTKVATVDSNWTTNPDNTSVYIVLGRIL